jgi:hypothetical protein
MLDHIDLITTAESNGAFSVTSPQLPGFVFGRASLDHVVQELNDALAFAGVPDGNEARRVHHLVMVGETLEGVEWIVRWANDEHRGEREVARDALLLQLASEKRFELIGDGPYLRTGEMQFVACLPGDTLGWVMGQMDQRGDALTIAVVVGDRFAALPLVKGDLIENDGYRRLSDLGLSEESTVADLLERSLDRSQLLLV